MSSRPKKSSKTGAPTVDARPVVHFRWDMDKTYIRTEFDTIADLLRTFRQRPEDKQTIPGARALLRELLNDKNDGTRRKIMFISGSPRQMRRVLTEKLRLDGIEPDSFVLKPNLSNLLLMRFSAIRSQVGYKLPTLLRSRLVNPQTTEFLFGDDSEQDGFVYSLYADLVEGRLPPAALPNIMSACGVSSREIDAAGNLAGPLVHTVRKPLRARVRRIFIHLERRSPTARFAAYGARVVPVYNYFQAALMLQVDDAMDADAVVRVADAMGRGGYSPFRLANSVQDIVRRGYVPADHIAKVLRDIGEARVHLGMTPSRFILDFAKALATIQLPTPSPVPWLEEIDYVALASDRKYKPPRFQVPRISLLD